MIEKACALTGHRDLPPDFPEDKLYYALSDLVEEGYRTFYCGMARGFDLLALKCLVEIGKRTPLTIEACIPFLGQERNFPEKEKALYRELLPQCSRKTVLYKSYALYYFLARDRYMVDRCDLLFAYCIKSTGGAAFTVDYAKTKGKEVRLFL